MMALTHNASIVHPRGDVARNQPSGRLQHFGGRGFNSAFSNRSPSLIIAKLAVIAIMLSAGVGIGSSYRIDSQPAKNRAPSTYLRQSEIHSDSSNTESDIVHDDNGTPTIPSENSAERNDPSTFQIETVFQNPENPLRVAKVSVNNDARLPQTRQTRQSEVLDKVRKDARKGGEGQPNLGDVDEVVIDQLTKPMEGLSINEESADRESAAQNSSVQTQEVRNGEIIFVEGDKNLKMNATVTVSEEELKEESEEGSREVSMKTDDNIQSKKQTGDVNRAHDDVDDEHERTHSSPIGIQCGKPPVVQIQLMDVSENDQETSGVRSVNDLDIEQQVNTREEDDHNKNAHEVKDNHDENDGITQKNQIKSGVQRRQRRWPEDGYDTDDRQGMTRNDDEARDYSSNSEASPPGTIIGRRSGRSSANDGNHDPPGTIRQRDSTISPPGSINGDRPPIGYFSWNPNPVVGKTKIEELAEQNMELTTLLSQERSQRRDEQRHMAGILDELLSRIKEGHDEFEDVMEHRVASRREKKSESVGRYEQWLAEVQARHRETQGTLEQLVKASLAIVTEGGRTGANSISNANLAIATRVATSLETDLLEQSRLVSTLMNFARPQNNDMSSIGKTSGNKISWGSSSAAMFSGGQESGHLNNNVNSLSQGGVTYEALQFEALLRVVNEMLVQEVEGVGTETSPGLSSYFDQPRPENPEHVVELVLAELARIDQELKDRFGKGLHDFLNGNTV